MSARRPPPPVPVTVLTGFLGAGKTTLLNRLLADPAMAGTMVIVNEIGEIGLDHLLVETKEEVTLLASGCLCCALRGDLVSTLEDLCRRIDNGRLAPIQRLVIETTGLADPVPILATFASHPYLRLRWRLAGVVTVVDALSGLATLDSEPEAGKQAAAADRIALSKTDLVTDETLLEALRARLAALAPGAPVLDCAAGEAGADALLREASAEPARWLAFPQAEALAAGQAEAALHAGHDCAALGCAPRGLSYKGIGAADPAIHGAIRTLAIRSDAALAPQAFDIFLEMLRAAHGPKLLRVKGLVLLADDPARPLLVQGTQHVLHPLARLEAWPDGQAQTQLVFILRDLDPAYIEALWSAFAQAGASGQPGSADTGSFIS